MFIDIFKAAGGYILHATSACHLLFIVLSLPLFTYTYTWFRYLWQMYKRDESRDPIMPPYFFPYVGHAPNMALEAESYIRRLCSGLQGCPMHLTFLGRQIYIAMPGEHVKWLFSNSRRLAPTPSILDALVIFCGLSEEDQRVFRSSGSSQNGNQLIDNSRQTLMAQSRDFSIFLHGENLRSVMNRFIGNFVRELKLSDCNNHEWVNLPDLYSFMSACIFRAEVEALYGENILEICPTLCTDFWTFYDSVPILGRQLPKWLSPKSHAAQQKMLIHFSRWRIWCNAHFDWDNPSLSNVAYEPIWGSRYVRRMVRRHEDLGLSDQGIASAMLGYMFVTVANTIPLTLWMMLHILMDQDVSSQVESEIATAVQQQPFQVKREALMKLPLLSSISCETLRLYAASSVGRTSNSEIRIPGGWKIRPGIPVMASNWLGGLDESFWNVGNASGGNRPDHPVHTFWAERFLQYNDKPMTGPSRKMQPMRHITRAETSNIESRDRPAKVITKGEGLEGHWFPFGGGAFRCPGEALAKETISISVAVVLNSFDVELVDPTSAKLTSSSHRTWPFVTRAFDRPVAVRIRQKGLRR